MKTIIVLLFLILFASNIFAVVDRVIDAEIPINDDFVDFEENFDEVLISVLMVGFLSIGAVGGTIVFFFAVYLISIGVRLL
ncbi:hypothetical protein LCGC14_0700250 [marine sediment metagenome]|uniref:Uncharacterized protein n=1 Tax=marine sediment metagenome TaxID=412755 RepID=A0A0F9TQS0_9ZZZZ